MENEERFHQMFADGPAVVTLGLPLFHESLVSQEVKAVQVDWKPPCGGDEKLTSLLGRLQCEKVEKANEEAAKRLIDSHPVLVDICQAKEVIPGLTKEKILHAGPPITWDRMCGPMQGAVTGALIYEGLAENKEAAKRLARSGSISFDPCHHHHAVGPMAGILSASMYVFVVENRTFGNRAYCSLNEGLGKVLRFGAYDWDVIDRLRWMEKVLAPSLKKAVALSGGIDVKNLTSQALMMGDECHNRNVGGTLQFLKHITPFLLKSEVECRKMQEIYEFIAGNVHFFLNLSMAACKATADTILGLNNSTILSCMARNGVEIGIRVAGLGEQWFTAPAGMPKGLYFSGFSEEDANNDLGDSTISEVAGIGAVAMAAAPAIVKFVGGSAGDALKATQKMYEITQAMHRDYTIPSLDFSGTPVGIDVRKVVETGITPIINTGIAHKKAGVGQIGAGILDAPMECFVRALEAMEKVI
ncbi:MAG: DUF1116 domain-containing protein [Candidatus Eremiobacteraeota bacterium]|nr:DUF1116 domain-containing protein [Candidatus Eremiobacteraeota bacterium]